MPSPYPPHAFLMLSDHKVWLGALIIVIGLVAKYSFSSPAVSHQSAPRRAPSTKAATTEAEWPWTEETQPSVKEVLERAAKLKTVGGRPIDVTVIYNDSKAAIVQVDNFMTPDQCDLMIQLAK